MDQTEVNGIMSKLHAAFPDAWGLQPDHVREILESESDSGDDFDSSTELPDHHRTDASNTVYLSDVPTDYEESDEACVGPMNESDYETYDDSEPVATKSIGQLLADKFHGAATDKFHGSADIGETVHEDAYEDPFSHGVAPRDDIDPKIFTDAKKLGLTLQILHDQKKTRSYVFTCAQGHSHINTKPRACTICEVETACKIPSVQRTFTKTQTAFIMLCARGHHSLMQTTGPDCQACAYEDTAEANGVNIQVDADAEHPITNGTLRVKCECSVEYYARALTEEECTELQNGDPANFKSCPHNSRTSSPHTDITEHAPTYVRTVAEKLFGRRFDAYSPMPFTAFACAESGSPAIAITCSTDPASMTQFPIRYCREIVHVHLMLENASLESCVRMLYSEIYGTTPQQYVFDRFYETSIGFCEVAVTGRPPAHNTNRSRDVPTVPICAEFNENGEVVRIANRSGDITRAVLRASLNNSSGNVSFVPVARVFNLAMAHETK